MQAADFGPKTSLKVVDKIRSKLKDGKLKSGEQIRSQLKQSILELLQTRGGNTDLQLGDTQPSVILVVGVNGGGKTTTIGKLAHKFNSEGAKVRVARVAHENHVLFQQVLCKIRTKGCALVMWQMKHLCQVVPSSKDR